VSDALASELWEKVGALSSALRLLFVAGSRADADIHAAPIGFVALAPLRHLVRHGPQTITGLALKDRVSTQAISLRVAPLLHAGLVARGVDPTDRRRTVLSVTDQGREYVEAAHAAAYEELEQAVGQLSTEDRNTLVSALPVLDRLAEHLAGPTSQSPAATRTTPADPT